MLILTGTLSTSGTQNVAERLKEYVKENCSDPNQRIFRICYEAARAIVKKTGDLAGELVKGLFESEKKDQGKKVSLKKG